MTSNRWVASIVLLAAGAWVAGASRAVGCGRGQPSREDGLPSVPLAAQGYRVGLPSRGRSIGAQPVGAGGSPVVPSAARACSAGLSSDGRFVRARSVGEVEPPVAKSARSETSGPACSVCLTFGKLAKDLRNLKKTSLRHHWDLFGTPFGPPFSSSEFRNCSKYNDLTKTPDKNANSYRRGEGAPLAGGLSKTCPRAGSRYPSPAVYRSGFIGREGCEQAVTGEWVKAMSCVRRICWSGRGNNLQQARQETTMAYGFSSPDRVWARRGRGRWRRPASRRWESQKG